MERKELEYAFRDVLMGLFYGSPILNQHSDLISIYQVRELPNVRTRHNYQRDKVIYEGHWDIKYKGRRLAHIQLKPHKKATIYAFYDNVHHYAQKVFERVLWEQLPEVKVEVKNEE